MVPQYFSFVPSPRPTPTDGDCNNHAIHELGNNPCSVNDDGGSGGDDDNDDDDDDDDDDEAYSEVWLLSPLFCY